MKAFLLSGLCTAALWGSAAQAQDYGATTQSTRVETKKHPTGATTGVYAQLGGGTEGYTGQLAPEVNPGLTYGATVGYRPIGYLGFELGYSGGLSDTDFNRPGGGGISDGPDIVRNGGQAVVVGNVTDTRLQPYIMGGIGVENYNVRNDARGAALGFQDDTGGYVPAGLGLRYQVTKLVTADARVNYNFLFSQDFAPGSINAGAGDGRYSALLSLGGTY